MNLTTPRSARMSPDTKEMVDARIRFLDAGHYGQLMAAIAERAGGDVVVDVGCGPGHYLERVSARAAIGIDLSKDAIRAAARRVPGAIFAVADATRRIPVRSGAVEAVMSVFAPRPLDEFRRVLRPGGRVVVGAAAARHMNEAVERFALLSVGDAKRETLIDALGAHLSVEDVVRITYEASLTGAELADLIVMGPNYWHTTPEVRAEAAALPWLSVTVDALVVVARAR